MADSWPPRRQFASHVEIDGAAVTTLCFIRASLLPVPRDRLGGNVLILSMQPFAGGRSPRHVRMGPKKVTPVQRERAFHLVARGGAGFDAVRASNLPMLVSGQPSG